MANVLVSETSLTNIANAIRSKNGTQTTYKPDEMSTAISNIQTSVDVAANKLSFGYSSFTTIPSMLDFSSVTNMEYMFSGCRNLTDISSLDTSSATRMNYMFDTCLGLTTIPLLNTSSVTDMLGMFRYCTYLTTIPLLNTSSVTTMSSMFSSCTHLTTIPAINTSSVVSMSSMFSNATALETVSLLNAASVNDVNRMFRNCTALENFGGLQNLGASYLTTQAANNNNYTLDLSTSTSLTEQSLINVLTNLYDIATKGCNTQKCTIGATNLAKLTSDAGQAALAQAQQYGWTVS